MSESDQSIFPKSIPGKAVVGLGLGILGAYHLLKLERNLNAEELKENPQLPQSITSAQLTPDQEAAANLTFYCGMLGILEENVGKYFPHDKDESWHIPQPYILGYPQNNPATERDKSYKVAALEDMYFAHASSDTKAIKGLRDKLGEDVYRIEDVYRKTYPTLDQLRKDIDSDVHSWNLKKRLDVAIKAALVYTGATEDQQMRILRYAGYTEDEIRTLVRGLAFSAVSSIGLGFAYEGLGYAAAGIGASTMFLGSDISTPEVLIPVAASYIGYYGTMIIGAEVNTRLMRNPRIKTTANITATSTYLLLDKTLPSQEYFNSRKNEIKLQPSTMRNKIAAIPFKTFFSSREAARDNGTRLASLLLEPQKEIGWALTVLIPYVGPSMIAAANTAGIILNGGQVAIGAAILATHPDRE